MCRYATAPGGKSDPVAAHEPVALGPLGELPHERPPLDLRRPEERLVARNVVDHVIARPGLDTVGMVRELQDQ